MLLVEPSYLSCLPQMKAEVARGPLRVETLVPESPPCGRAPLAIEARMLLHSSSLMTLAMSGN
jgi:hypothetical protein